MTVQLKVLKGFRQNSLSMIVKSDYELMDHLINAKEKLLAALNKIIDHYQLEIYFYHKIQVKIELDNYYLSTKEFKLTNPKVDLENSYKELISMGHNKAISHFINFIIIKGDCKLRISDEDFRKISNTIMNESININTTNSNKANLFIDDIKESLFIDEDNDETDLRKKWRIQTKGT